jgi:uncharacterized membrane protein
MIASAATPTAATPAPARLVYLDVARGVAVLIMVLAHVVDSWTREVDRHDVRFYTAVFVGGLGAPMFLFLAGLAQTMSASAKARRADDRHAGFAAMWRRGWEVFALAWLFRLQSQLLGWGAFRNVLKVDILNVMGLSMVLTALLWRVGRSRTQRIALFALATAAATFTTPLVRAVPWLASLADPIEAYIRPAGPYAAFTMLPWAGFVFAGAIVGELIDALRLASYPARSGQASTGNVRTASVRWRLQVPLAVAGVAGALLGWWASFQPSIYATSDFWTSSPTFFFIRLGIVTALVPATWAHCEFWLAPSERDGSRVEGWRRPGVAISRAVEVLGRSSLFVYWIHVEMVYGVIAEPIKRSLPLVVSLIATLLLCALLFWLTKLKNRRMEGVELPPRVRILAAVLR